MSSTITRVAKPPVNTEPEIKLRRFTVAEYDEMIRVGILNDEDRVELLNGWVVEKMAHNPPHDSAVYRVQVALMTLLGRDYIVRAQSSVTLSESVPEPDVAVAPGPVDRYDKARPTSSELVVEVSDSSLKRDRTTKLAIYAAAKVPVYWIVNLIDRRVEVYTSPRGGKNPAYRQQKAFSAADRLPVVIGGKAVGDIAVGDLLP